MPHAIRPGDVLADRYQLVDLLSESGDGRFWRAHDRVLERHVALHVIAEDDPRAPGLVEAARRSATVLDPRILRVLDAERAEGICYVVNEWGSGTSLDILVANHGPLPPRRAAWVVCEVAASIATAHAAGVAHGRLAPENVLIDHAGGVKVIGLAVDAALHGLPGNRPADDVADLAGLLHCALTATWAGRSHSVVPGVPRDGGRVLRPRQVRAGVPRTLDALCDEVLNSAAPHPLVGRGRDLPLDSARAIQEVLADFVGDPTGLREQLAAAQVTGAQETVVLPALPDGPWRSPGAPDDTDPTLLAQPAVEPAPELPTQAGLPVWDDAADDVSWLDAPGTPAPPPPPFEDPPERPLFAPEPQEGEPTRRSRPGARVSTGQDFWPWDTSSTGRGTGTGITAVPDPAVGPPVVDEVPGRSWLRLAAGIGASLLLLVAVVVAFNLGRGKTPLGTEVDDEPTRASSPTATPTLTALSGLSAVDFDPEGGNGENPETVANAVDGDPATTWRTLTYEQQFGPGGLKDGVGLVIDLGGPQDVGALDLTLVGEPTGVAAYVSDAAPGTVADLDEPVATRDAGTREEIVLDEPVTGRFLTLWLTSLPGSAGAFRGEVAEVGVRAG